MGIRVRELLKPGHWFGKRRERGDDADPQVTSSGAAEAQRLRIALDAGSMGTWTWDRATGVVTWDERLEGLFGLPRGGFDRTFEGWVALIHPDDRERALAALDEAVQNLSTLMFDHRVIWPDGSVHWIEGRGEPVVDDTGYVIGASGVALDIDARRATEAENELLLLREHRARQVAEESSDALHRLATLSLALSNATTVEEVAAAAVEHGPVALRARYSWVATINPRSDEMVTRAYKGYDPAVMDEYLVIPLDAELPATTAARATEPIFIESPEDRRARYPEFPETGAHGSLVLAPIELVYEWRAVLAFGYDDARPFTDETRAYITAVVEACSAAFRRAAAFEAEQASRGRLRMLLDLSEAIARDIEPDEVLSIAARYCAQRIGRYATAFVAEPAGLRWVTTVHADPALQRACEDLIALGIDGRAGAERVVDGGETLVVQRASPDSWESQYGDRARELLEIVKPTSVMTVPVRIANRTLGALVIGHDRNAAFSTQDVELATDVGRRAASAHERATMRKATQEKLAHEHETVEVLQRSIVPGQLPEVPAAELVAEYRPAEVSYGVGGDWYDAFELGDELMLIVGDVAGHGVDAARLMVRVRNAFRAYAVEDPDPGSLLARVDRALRMFDTHEMVTAVIARYNPATGALAWSRAGHLPPLVCDGDGATRFLDDVNSPPLGTMARGFETAHTHLTPGSILALYTDGLVERRDAILDDGLAWLADRVCATRHEPLDKISRLLTDDPFVPHPSPDDICVLALRTSR